MAAEIAADAERHGRDEIDLTDVEFISRSCADELVNQAQERGLEIVGASGNTAQMLEVVRSH